jgi:2-dehydropantoate 2-reductase
MKMLVVGAGATGGYFGGRLAQAGRDVTFLVRPARRDALAKDGLQIVSPGGVSTLRPRLVLASEIDGPYDVVLLTVKAFALEAAMADMRAAVGPHTAILPLLNGMRHLDALDKAFAPENVMGCLARIVGSVDAKGRIVQATPMHDIVYGERDGKRSDRAARIDAFMQRAGFDARLSDAILPEMWTKWVMLASLGAVTCLMRGNVGQIASAQGGVKSASLVLDEVESIVSKVGSPTPPGALTQIRAMLTDPASSMTSSMYRDLASAQRVEVEQILGDLIRRGDDAGVDAPLVRAATVGLRIYEAAPEAGTPG